MSKVRSKTLTLTLTLTLPLPLTLALTWGMPQMAPRRDTAVEISSEKRVSHRKDAHLVVRGRG